MSIRLRARADHASQELLDNSTNTKPVVVVPVGRIVPVAVGGPYVARFVVPGAAAQHTIAFRTDLRLRRLPRRGFLPRAEQVADLAECIRGILITFSGEALKVKTAPQIQTQRFQDTVCFIKVSSSLCSSPDVRPDQGAFHIQRIPFKSLCERVPEPLWKPARLFEEPETPVVRFHENGCFRYHPLLS